MSILTISKAMELAQKSLAPHGAYGFGNLASMDWQAAKFPFIAISERYSATANPNNTTTYRVAVHILDSDYAGSALDRAEAFAKCEAMVRPLLQYFEYELYKLEQAEGRQAQTSRQFTYQTSILQTTNNHTGIIAGFECTLATPCFTVPEPNKDCKC